MTWTLWLAQSRADDEAAAVMAFLTIVLGFVCGTMLITTFLWAFVCWIISGSLKRIPETYRLMSPGQVWLLMIPFFNIFWNFFVFLRVADSFKVYFNAQGDTSVNDCGKQLGLIYCISVCCLLVPYLNVCVFFVALTLLVMVLLKFNELKNRIPHNTGADR